MEDLAFFVCIDKVIETPRLFLATSGHFLKVTSKRAVIHNRVPDWLECLHEALDIPLGIRLIKDNQDILVFQRLHDVARRANGAYVTKHDQYTIRTMRGRFLSQEPGGRGQTKNQAVPKPPDQNEQAETQW